MGMVFTHGITHNTGTFSVRFVRTIIQFYHGVQNSSLYRLQTVPDIRQCPGCNNTHGILNVGLLHFFL